MLSKNKQKLIRQLAQKKYRDELSVFVAELPKVVEDLLPYMDCQYLLATREFLDSHPQVRAEEIIEISAQELKTISSLNTPREVIAVFRMPHVELREANHALAEAECGLVLALDGVQDPGNMGTIIRLADWFGIRHIVCSRSTADCYGPKVVQATMGALARVSVHYTDLERWLESLSPSIPVYGTHLDGTNMYEQELSACGVIVMGNEGNGISPGVARLVNKRLFIPSFPPDQPTSESLNVAIATAVVCAEFRRRIMHK